MRAGIRAIRTARTIIRRLGLITVVSLAFAFSVPGVAQASVPTIFHGTVLDAATGLPIPGVVIDAEYYEMGVDWYPAGSAITGIDGSYSLPNTQGRPAGIYNVRFISPIAYGYPVQWEFADWDGINPTELNLTLGEAPVIAAGTVRDGATGDPMPGAGIIAWVNMAEEGAEPSWSTIASITCSAEGTYTIRDIYTQGAGQYRFRFSTPTAPQYESYLPQDFTESWNGTDPIALNVTLGPAVPLATGTVRNHANDAVLSGAHIDAYADVDGEWTWTGSAESGYDGLYTVKDLLGFSAGEFKLVYSAPDGDEFGAYERKTILRSWDGGEPLSIDATLAAVIATGTVTDSIDGLPISGASVKVEHYDGYWAILESTVTGALGAFSFTDMTGTGPGEYRIVAQSPGYGTEVITRSWNATQTMQVPVSLQPLAADGYEPDDSAEQAGTIDTSGTPRSHTIFPGTDLDFATFQAKAGTEYTITTLDQHGTMDTVLQLLVDGAFVTENDDAQGRFSQIIWTAEQDGTAHVRVSAYSGSSAPEPGFYGLSVVASFTAPVPPSSTQLTLTTGSAVLSAYGQAYTCSGRLASGETSIANVPVRLMQSTSAVGTYASAGKIATTAVDGAFTFTGIKPTAKMYYKVVFDGVPDTYTSSESPAVFVLPRAYVGNPVAPTTMYSYKSNTVYGYLKPKHTGAPVRIYKYRYVSGKWKAYSFVTAKAVSYSSSTTTKYSLAVRLPYRGKWRLRAYHPADAGHAASWSAGYDYVTVR